MQRWSERQLAMLRELGVQQFWPAPAEALSMQQGMEAARAGMGPAAAGTDAGAHAHSGAGADSGAGSGDAILVEGGTSAGGWQSASQVAEAAGVLGSRPPAPLPADPAPSRAAAPASADEPAFVEAVRPLAPAGVAGRTAPPPGARGPAAPGTAIPLGPRPSGVESMDWTTLRDTVAGCRACGLCEGRRQTVFGVGNQAARWMLIGEAPGEQEDRQGEPFVGRAGQLLDRMLAAVGLTRAEDEAARQVYIANVIKCRPPGNRNPLPEEVAQCEPYLLRQVSLVQPRLIVAMGRFAVQSLLKSSEPIGRLRGRVHDYHGVPLVVTYHPAYLLRNPADKALAWDDLCLAREVMARGGRAG